MDKLKDLRPEAVKHPSSLCKIDLLLELFRNLSDNCKFQAISCSINTNPTDYDLLEFETNEYI